MCTAGTHRLVHTYVCTATRSHASRQSEQTNTAGCAKPNPDASAHSACAFRPSKQPDNKAMTRCLASVNTCHNRNAFSPQLCPLRLGVSGVLRRAQVHGKSGRGTRGGPPCSSTDVGRTSRSTSVRGHCGACSFGARRCTRGTQHRRRQALMFIQFHSLICAHGSRAVFMYFYRRRQDKPFGADE